MIALLAFEWFIMYAVIKTQSNKTIGEIQYEHNHVEDGRSFRITSMTFAQQEKTYKTLFIIFLAIYLPLDFSLDLFLRFYDVRLAIAYYSISTMLIFL